MHSLQYDQLAALIYDSVGAADMTANHFGLRKAGTVARRRRGHRRTMPVDT